MSPKIKISKKGGASNSEGKPTQYSCSNKQFNQIIDISVQEDMKKLEIIIKIPKSTDKGGYFINPHYSINKAGEKLQFVYQCKGTLLRDFLKVNLELSFYIYGLLNIANGIVELEKQGFTHNNISIDNILVTDKQVENIQNKILLTNLSGVLEDNQLDTDAIALGKVITEILEVYTEETMRKSLYPEIKHQINIHTKLTKLVRELDTTLPPKNATRSILLAEGLDSIKRFDVAFWKNSQKPTNSTTPEGGRSATKKAKQPPTKSATKPPTKSATKPSTKKATKQSTKQAKLPVKRPSKIVSK
jgi:hypothetical protein